MIGLGAKYLTAAGFGRYRITAASLGNLDLLVKNWLLPATKQDIIGAFGDDGMAVINATNAYLNGIAASDRDKATALAGFINEDPMMVCSLGLEPQGVDMPIRWLVSSGGNNYFDLGVTPNQDSYAHVVFEKEGTLGGMSFGSRESVSSKTFGITHPAATGVNHFYGNGYSHFTNVQSNKHFDIIMDKNKLYLGGVLLSTRTYMTFTCHGTAIVFGMRNGNSISVTDTELRFCVIELDGHNYVPYKHKTGENTYSAELLDLETLTTCQRTGSFTIPDISYTPSTT